VLFFPVAGAATILTWWPLSATLAVALSVLTVGIPLLCVALYLTDLIWAPFCMEMTYVTVWCWVLCPAGVFLNYIGMALGTLRAHC